MLARRSKPCSVRNTTRLWPAGVQVNDGLRPRRVYGVATIEVALAPCVTRAPKSMSMMTLGGPTPRGGSVGVRAFEFGALDTECHDKLPQEPPREAAAAEPQTPRPDRLLGTFRVSELEMIFPNVHWHEGAAPNGVNKGKGQAPQAQKRGRLARLLARWRSKRSADGERGHEDAVRVESGSAEAPQEDPEGTDATRTTHHEPGSH